MNKKYYDNDALKIIHQKFKGHELYSALADTQKYLKKYPNDLMALLQYCHILLRLGEFETVQNCLDVIELNNDSFDHELEILKIKLYLNSYQGNYEECGRILENSLISRNCRLSFLSYIRKQLGQIDISDINSERYICEQMKSYNEEKAIEHIKKHLNEDCCETFNVFTKFNENFPIEEIYTKLKRILPSESKIYSRGYQNIYFFKYDGCGLVDDKIIDYFYVCTFQNSNKIITMYPCHSINIGKIRYTDLNDYANSNKKIKRISQIDKFNQKYGRK